MTTTGRALRALKGRFGISAPRVAVRTHLPWHLRWGVLALLAAMATVLSWFSYDAGRSLAGFEKGRAEEERAQLETETARLKKENEGLRARAAVAESQLQIERASQGDLAGQVKALGDENARLREDLAFFQNLMPVTGKEGALRVYRFKVERDKQPHQYRYGLLLLQTGGARAKDFQGSLQFLINLQQNGRKLVLPLPEDDRKFPQGQPISFKHYQRVEGTFRIPPGAVVESLQLRVFFGGETEARLTQSVGVS